MSNLIYTWQPKSTVLSRRGHTDVTPGSTSTTTSTQQGAKTLGTANYAIPTTGTVVYLDPANGNNSNAGTSASAPKKTLANVLTSYTSATIIVRAGAVHENVTVGVNAGPYVLQNYPGETVWFDGSSVVTNWTQSGSLWYATLLAQFDHTNGTDMASDVDSSYPMGFWPDGCFCDGTRLTITNSSTPSSGQVYFDYTNNKAWIADDPSGHEMRLSDLVQGITCGGQCSIYGIGFRRYATNVNALGAVRFAGSASHGSTYGYNTVENCWFYDNGGTGCSFNANYSTALYCTTTLNRGNGFSAYVGSGDSSDGGHGLTITDNVISFNNQARLSVPASSTAGMKIAQFQDVVIARNLFDQNLQCSGFWSDFNTFNMQIVNNVFNPGVASPSGGPSHASISLELTDTVIVAGNTINAGLNGMYKWPMSLDNTGNTKIYNNKVTGGSVVQFYILQDNRRNGDSSRGGTSISVSQCPWITQNVEICNNIMSGNNCLFVRDQNDGDADHEGIHTATMMISKVQGNDFIPPSSGSVVIAWGNGTGSNTTYYTSAAAFATANSGYGPNNDNTTSTTNCVALPSDVAAAVGQPTGTVHLGTF